MNDFNNDSEFRLAVERVLHELIDQIDDIDADDFDSRLTPGSLIVSFDDGAVVMLSQQTPTHELWLSANFTAWHFLRSNDVWVERDSKEPMLVVLNKIFSEKFGEPIQLEL